MKSGAGDDPFADDPFEEDEEDADDEPSEALDDSPADETDSETDTVTEPQTDTDGDERSGREVAGIDDRSADAASESATGGTRRSDARSSSESTPAAGQSEGAPENSDETDDAETQDIPWVLRRSRVKEDRDNVHQFFLRDEYSKAEDEIIAAVADELDVREKQLKKLDVREAMVATADAEAIAETLSNWGYEYVD